MRWTSFTCEQGKQGGAGSGESLTPRAATFAPMTWHDDHTALERFLRYVRVFTESDPASGSQPSTARQFDLLRILRDELREMGAAEVTLDEHGYLMATIPATVDHPLPTLCFCSHVDTSPDVTGEGVVPQVHDYTGGAIRISDELSLDEAELPYLREHRGHRVVTASGDTLLGADDKAGVASIMDAAQYLLRHPEVPHGKIRVLFTPDEEIGSGVDQLDVAALGADFGYTLDGGAAGSLEGESFSADGVTITVEGISAHPGYAKGKMVNATRAAAYLLEQLPHDRLTPETTSGREGFVHCVGLEGKAELARLTFIVRDHATPKLDEHVAVLEAACAKTRARYPRATVTLVRKHQYRNMGEVLAEHPQVMANAREAIRRVGLPVIEEPIRGGTDGSRLSFMGLPCPNLFTGMQMIHSRREWVGERDMNLAAACIVELVQVWAERP